MATGTAGSAARQYHQQMLHYLRKAVNYNDSGISTGVKIGTLPAGAIIIGTDVNVQTVFNAATTNVLTAGGNSATYNDVVAAADVNEAATGITKDISPTGSSLGVIAADRDIYAMYTQTGAVATTGLAHIIVKYVPANDQ
jgi:hypothetical protein